MKSIDDLFRLWPSIPEMANDVGESHWTVGKWKQRKRIPSSAWPAVANAVKRKGKKLSGDDLMTMHARSATR